MNTFTHHGNSLVINFLNTVQIHQHQVVDLLHDQESVWRWGKEMTSCHQLELAQFQKIFLDQNFNLDELRRFRTTSRQCVSQLLKNRTTGTHFWTQFEEKTCHSPLSFAVIGERVIPIPHTPRTDGLLALLAYDFMQLKAKDQLLRIKKCANPECLALFVDASGKRKWCSMQACGNRSKVGKYLQRKQSSH